MKKRELLRQLADIDDDEEILAEIDFARLYDNLRPELIGVRVGFQGAEVKKKAILVIGNL